jgi:hypothetical protein
MFKSEFLKIFFAFSFVGAIVIGVIYFIDPFSAQSSYYDIWELAEQGDVEAQQRLGLNHFYGQDGFPQDYETAVYWYRRAAEQGLHRSQHNLAGMYFYGWGVAQCYEQAAFWYGLAAEQGFRYSQTNLGHLYREGNGVPQDYQMALQLFTLAAEQGCESGQTSLETLTRVLNVYVDRDLPLAELREAAYAGNPSAQFDLSGRYFKGEVDAEDYGQCIVTRGLFWMISAATNGNYPYAQHILGAFFAAGFQIFPIDEDLSSDEIIELLFSLSPEDDFPFELSPYVVVDGVPDEAHVFIQDFERTVYFWQLAAEQGHLYSQIYIGVVEEYGISILEDYDNFLEITYNIVKELSLEQKIQIYEEGMRVLSRIDYNELFRSLSLE